MKWLVNEKASWWKLKLKTNKLIKCKVDFDKMNDMAESWNDNLMNWQASDSSSLMK